MRQLSDCASVASSYTSMPVAQPVFQGWRVVASEHERPCIAKLSFMHERLGSSLFQRHLRAARDMWGVRRGRDTLDASMPAKRIAWMKDALSDAAPCVAYTSW